MTAPLITSRHNPRLKEAAKLRDARERRRTGRFLVDGARETLRALAAGAEPVEAFVSEGLDDALTTEALAELERRSTPLSPVAPEAFAKLAYGQRETGLVLVATAPKRSLGDLKLPADPLVVVLEGVEKPGNLGAILRTADGAGVDAVVVADPRTDLMNPNTIRASVGAVFKQNIAVATTEETIAWLAGRGLRTLVTRPEAAERYDRTDLAGGVALVLGSEAHGLSDAWERSALKLTALSLPMAGVADSLNVSAAAAVLLYEARRQRDAV
ncbi:23S rRNA (guanosine-2'-O-)-methyltransferase RlmB [Pseudobythopirellula maris]|uniref:23S rRNA (Guanosine-2'-O-)-methyltransferase RlmB n=1 Tax=Pseudobythopirellula maris TaxID=2527991 RepID=A0A5C5ZNW9_9BACT|nr:TrmH family RNA methyltransferase [Pseudobythopirellula maris]TWT88836.1 23S rRNA (guanosine-2'-O-)-methyltransferase RlmB [Pseudobythopirellula maris]